jgi:hypothetical protein
MTRRVLVEVAGNTALLPGNLVDRTDFLAANAAVLAEGGAPATARETVLGITRAALASDSFLAAASFQETTRVLADAALARRVDGLRGLKENVLLGRPIPAGTGFRAAVAPGRPVPVTPLELTPGATRRRCAPVGGDGQATGIADRDAAG